MGYSGKKIIKYSLRPNMLSRHQISEAVDAIAFAFIDHREKEMEDRVRTLTLEGKSLTTNKEREQHRLKMEAEINAMDAEAEEMQRFLEARERSLDAETAAARGSFHPHPSQYPYTAMTHGTAMQIPVMRTGFGMLEPAREASNTNAMRLKPQACTGVVNEAKDLEIALPVHQWVDLPLSTIREKCVWYSFLDEMATSAQIETGPDGNQRTVYWRKSGEYTETGFVTWAIRRMQKQFKEASKTDKAPWMVSSPLIYRVLERLIQHGNFTTPFFMEWAVVYMDTKYPFNQYSPAMWKEPREYTEGESGRIGS